MTSIPTRIAKGDNSQPKYTTTVRNPTKVPNAKGAPVVAKQHARLVGGYTGGTTRQRNPPSVAYLNNLARTWKMPWAIRQRLVAPADKTDVFVSDPRGIVGGTGVWQNKEDYFRNLSVRGLGRNPELLNPERTPHCYSMGGKPFQPRGLTYRFLENPQQTTVERNPPTIPLYRGW